MKCEQLGAYTYRWDEGCFPLGADALALGEFCTLKPRQRVLDLGCGAGALMLLCARREPTVTLVGVERDPHAASWAKRNAKENNLTVEILQGDLAELVLPRSDLVISNPPWYPEGSGKAGGPGCMGGCTLRQLCESASSALSHKGRFAVVYRADGLTDLLTEARRVSLEPKRLQFCMHRAGKAPYAVLMEAVKGGRSGVKVLSYEICE